MPYQCFQSKNPKINLSNFFLRFNCMERQRYSESKRQKDVSSVGSLPKWRQRQELNWSEGRRQELLNLPCECRILLLSQATIRNVDGMCNSWIWTVTSGRSWHLQGGGLAIWAILPGPEQFTSMPFILINYNQHVTITFWYAGCLKCILCIAWPRPVTSWESWFFIAENHAEIIIWINNRCGWVTTQSLFWGLFNWTQLGH